MAKSKVVRRWQVFPGRASFFCDGRLISSKKSQVFWLTSILIVGTSIPFFAFDCRYLAENVSPVIPIAAALMFIFVMSTLLTTRFTDPGIIPRATPDEAAVTEREINSWQEVNKGPRCRDTIVNGQVVRMKYCFTCKMFRPPRASHCSICDSCIERFDHHCPWVGNCVGKRNYRYFYFFIAGLTVYCIFILSCVVTHMVMRSQPSGFLEVMKQSPFSIVEGIICFFSMWSVIGLCCFHTNLVCRGETTNEDIKGTYSRKFGNQKNPFSHGSGFRNCGNHLCGVQPPSLVQARRVLVPEPMLSLSADFSGAPPVSSAAPAISSVDPTTSGNRLTSHTETAPVEAANRDINEPFISKSDASLNDDSSSVPAEAGSMTNFRASTNQLVVENEAIIEQANGSVGSGGPVRSASQSIFYSVVSETKENGEETKRTPLKATTTTMANSSPVTPPAGRRLVSGQVNEALALSPSSSGSPNQRRQQNYRSMES